MNAPCRFCQERYCNCHDHCEKYKDFRMKIKIIREGQAKMTAPHGSSKYKVTDCSKYKI